MTNLVPVQGMEIAPARTLPDVTRNCDEDAPLAAGDPRWEDLSRGRGDATLPALRREFERRPYGKFVHTTLVSHRGAGKSTEIRRLTAELSDAYHLVYIEATREMDPFHIETEDLLLNLAMAVERDRRDAGTPLDDALLDRVTGWFRDVVKTTSWARGYSTEAAAGIEGKVSVPFLGSLFASAKALFKYGSEYRTEVKQELKKYPSALLDCVNDLLVAADRQLGDRSLLLVVDNLDRYEPEVIDRLLVGSADRVHELRANLLLTPPIGLLLQPISTSLDALYGCHFLHTVRLRRPDQPYDAFDGPGRDLLELALGRRIALDVMMPDRAARDRLISASGGSIRELLDLVSYAALIADGPTLERGDVDRAIARRKSRLRDLVNVNGWAAALVEIRRTKQVTDAEKSRAVLFHRLAFKYNGEGWYDVHPLVAELPEIKNADAAKGAPNG